MARLLISELFCGTLQGIIEICGKVVYVDTNNKNITIKVDDGSSTCNCFVWTEGYQPKFSSLLGKYIIVKGQKSTFLREIGLNISDLYLLDGLYDEICWKLLLLKNNSIKD